MADSDRKLLAGVLDRHVPREMHRAEFILVESPRLHYARRIGFSRFYGLTYRQGATIGQAILDASWSLTQRALLRKVISQQDQHLNMVLLPLLWMWAWRADKSDLHDFVGLALSAEPREDRDQWQDRRVLLLQLMEEQHPCLLSGPFWRYPTELTRRPQEPLQDVDERLRIQLPGLLHIFVQIIDENR